MVSRKDDASGKWEDKPIDCWELLAVRGEAGKVASPATTAGTAPTTTSSVTPNQQALSLLNGKTEQQWHQAVFVDPAVKADMPLIQSIINRTFLGGLEAAGRVKKEEDGTYRIIP